MIVKTTKQIIDETNYDCLNCGSSRFRYWSNKEYNLSDKWVCLESLKKEIEKIDNLADDEYGFRIAVYKMIKDLCNSSEQNEERNQATRPKARCEGANPSVSSVSGEHKVTGEDEVPTNEADSSPVQNPKRMGGMGDASIQRPRVKKCTCKNPDRKYPQDGTNFDIICGRCGGALLTNMK